MKFFFGRAARELFLCAVFLCAVFIPAYRASADSTSCNLAKDAIDSASRLRGLRIKQPVPCLIHDKPEVRAYILETIRTQLPPERLANEELLFKALGFIPEDFNYTDGIVELYLSQIGGYYDPKKNHFVMAGWMPTLLQTTVAVHELTHALQDQYYDLESVIDSKINNSDLLLARSALVEGDATAVMTDYMMSLTGQPGIAAQADVNSLMLQNVVSVQLIGAAQNVPQSLQMLLIFPYTSGLRFAHELLRSGGYKAIDAAFSRLPDSTEEILHPEKYLAREKSFQRISREDVLAGAKEEVRHEDVVGEFGINALLGTFIQDKAQVARAGAGWGGDTVLVVADASGKKSVRWKTLWDTPTDAKEFWTEMEQMKKARQASPWEITARLEGKAVMLQVLRR